MLIKGNVPGAKNSYVTVYNGVKANTPAVNPEALAQEGDNNAQY